MIKTKRIYDEPQRSDGTRILVDRLWPRGISKERAKIDIWMKDVSPTPELRTWFSHDPNHWKEFRKMYMQELKENEDAKEIISLEKEKKDITLIYAAKDPQYNHANVLLEFLKKKYKRKRTKEQKIRT